MSVSTWCVTKRFSIWPAGIRRNGAWADVSFLVPASRKDGEQVRTVTVALQMFIGENGIDWGLLMAGGTLVGLPATVLFLLVQRKLVGGLNTGAVKG